MRPWYALSLLLFSLPSLARAEPVLFACSEKCPIALFEALELELRGHGGFLLARLSPQGENVEEHERDARRMAELTPNAAVLWVEREPPLRVRVLSTREATVRQAPLPSPPEAIEPRLFAAVAGDVVLTALHAQGARSPTPAPAAEAPAQPELLTLQAPVPAASPVRPRVTRVRRFFLRAAPALGFAVIKRGVAADRPPPNMAVAAALQAQLTQRSPEAGREVLRTQGYDCNWRPNPAFSSSMIADGCSLAVDASGFAVSPAVELLAGAYLSPRVALATFLRVTPTAGLGRLNHTLFGIQAEYAVLPPAPTGFWLNLGGGLGFGRIQVKPSTRARSGPYATSGPYAAHLTLPFGYRLLPGFGLYGTLSTRVLFRDVLWVVEPALGVEGRL